MKELKELKEIMIIEKEHNQNNENQENENQKGEYSLLGKQTEEEKYDFGYRASLQTFRRWYR